MKISEEVRFLINLLFINKKIDDKKLRSLNYDNLVKISSSHLILPLLYINFKRKKYLKFLPKNLKSYLIEIYGVNRERNKVLLNEIKEISEILKNKKLNHVFLKGSANIFCGLYSDIGERMIGDIDLLLSNKDVNIANEILKDYGYYSKLENDKIFPEKHRHIPRLINKKKLFALEIHSRVVNRDIDNLRTEEIIKRKMNINGLFIPSFECRLLQNIYSYQLNDYGNSKISYSFRNLYDSYQIAKVNNSKLEFIKYDKYINNYFTVAEELGIKYFKKFNYKHQILHSYRFKIKYKNKFYYKIDENIIKKAGELKYIYLLIKKYLKNQAI